MSKKEFNLSMASMEEIQEEQERLDRERHKIREQGRVLKSEINRRNMVETIVSKLSLGAPLKDEQTEYLRGLNKKDRDGLLKEAEKKRNDRAKAIADSLKSMDK